MPFEFASHRERGRGGNMDMLNLIDIHQGCCNGQGPLQEGAVGANLDPWQGTATRGQLLERRPEAMGIPYFNNC